MQYVATNAAENSTLETAKKLVEKLTKLGFTLGGIHANGQTSGAEEANIVPVEELTLENGKPYLLVVFSGGDWRNIALLERMFGSGSISEFDRVSTELGVLPSTAIQRVPGYAKAIEKLIAKA